jgi:FG-GAP-like repeat
MRFLSWLHGLKPAASRRRTKRGPPRQPRSVQLAVETLEARCLLSFSPAANYPVAAFPLDMVVADLNGDGKPDLVTINGAQVSVLPGRGDGTFGTAQTNAIGSAVRGVVAAGDFNGDGRLDLVTTTMTSVLVLLNNTAALGGPVTFQAAGRLLSSRAQWPWATSTATARSTWP